MAQGIVHCLGEDGKVGTKTNEPRYYILLGSICYYITCKPHYEQKVLHNLRTISTLLCDGWIAGMSAFHYYQSWIYNRKYVLLHVHYSPIHSKNKGS